MPRLIQQDDKNDELLMHEDGGGGGGEEEEERIIAGFVSSRDDDDDNNNNNKDDGDVHTTILVYTSKLRVFQHLESTIQCYYVQNREEEDIEMHFTAADFVDGIYLFLIHERSNLPLYVKYPGKRKEYEMIPLPRPRKGSFPSAIAQCVNTINCGENYNLVLAGDSLGVLSLWVQVSNKEDLFDAYAVNAFSEENSKIVAVTSIYMKTMQQVFVAASNDHGQVRIWSMKILSEEQKSTPYTPSLPLFPYTALNMKENSPPSRSLSFCEILDRLMLLTTQFELEKTEDRIMFWNIPKTSTRPDDSLHVRVIQRPMAVLIPKSLKSISCLATFSKVQCPDQVSAIICGAENGVVAIYTISHENLRKTKHLDFQFLGEARIGSCIVRTQCRVKSTMEFHVTTTKGIQGWNLPQFLALSSPKVNENGPNASFQKPTTSSSLRQIKKKPQVKQQLTQAASLVSKSVQTTHRYLPKTDLSMKSQMNMNVVEQEQTSKEINKQVAEKIVLDSRKKQSSATISVKPSKPIQNVPWYLRSSRPSWVHDEFYIIPKKKL